MIHAVKVAAFGSINIEYCQLRWASGTTFLILTHNCGEYGVIECTLFDAIADRPVFSSAELFADVSPRGTYVYTADLQDRKEQVTIRKLATCEPVGRWFCPRGGFIAWSPDESLLAEVAVTERVYVRDAATGNRLRCLGEYPSHATIVEWSPDGRFLAVGGISRGVYIWDATSGEKRCTLRTNTLSIDTLTWSPDSRLLLAGPTRIWDAKTGKKRYALARVKRNVLLHSWQPTGRYIAAGVPRCGVYVWDANTGELQHTIDEPTVSHPGIAWSPDGHFLVVSTGSRSLSVYLITADRVAAEIAQDPRNQHVLGDYLQDTQLPG